MVDSEQKGAGRIDCFEAERVTLDAQAVGHLQDAFKQMDLLLDTKQVDGGLVCLVAMLRDLEALRFWLRQ